MTENAFTLQLVEEKSLEDLIRDLQVVTAEASYYEEQRKKAQYAVVSRLEEERRKAVDVDYPLDPTKKLRAVRVANRRLKFDDEGLHRTLPAPQWDAITVAKVDRSKLDEMVATGQISRETVKPYITVTEHPTVRLYVVDPDKDGDDETSSGEDT